MKKHFFQNLIKIYKKKQKINIVETPFLIDVYLSQIEINHFQT